MDPTLDKWFFLACAILHRAALDARCGNMFARRFLLEDSSAWLIESVGLDVDATRASLVHIWIEAAGEKSKRSELCYNCNNQNNYAIMDQ